MAMKNNFLPPNLVSNLEQVLNNRKGGNGDGGEEEEEGNEAPPTTSSTEIDESKPIVLVTNGDGIDSAGLVSLVQALVKGNLYTVQVCAPQSDRSVSGHAVTVCEPITVSSTEISGVSCAAYEVAGTPADCVSLALSGALFSWTKPALVISGINKGSHCGNHMFCSGAVAGAREALIAGLHSLSISLNWKNDESRESDFSEAVNVCLPLIHAAIRDIKDEVFPRSCSLNIEVPTSPSTNKGFKVTKQSLWRPSPSWTAVSANRQPGAGFFMPPNQQGIGLSLAQLGRDASAAGAARRLNTQRNNVEVESVGVAGKTDTQRVKRYFRLEFVDKEQKDMDEDLDFRALENGYVAITPLTLSSNSESEIHTSASNWITTALSSETTN